jgi:seryl-tRNA synthetase
MVADTKKVRSLEERKAAMLAEVEALEAKQLEKYRKELEAKRDRQEKVAKTIAKYVDEANSIDARVAELEALITELEADADDTDEDEPAEVEPSTPVLGVVNA